MAGKRNFLFVLLLLSVWSSNVWAQCGPESITATDWCENTFAKWEFDNPTPNAVYTWYKAGTYGPGDLDANGQIPSAVKYGSTTDPFFYSPFRVKQADVPPTGIQFTYVKSVPYKNVVPFPATTPAFTDGPSTGTPTYSMTFTSTTSIRLNSIKIPVKLYTAGQQYKIQVAFGTTAGTGSAVYTFTPAQATNIGGQNYLVTVPVDLTIPAGTQTLVVNFNPTGTGNPVDQLLYAPNQFAGGTYGPVTFGTSSAYHANGGYPNGYTMMYDWDYTVVCPPQTTPLAKLTTNGCCVLPTSINLLSLNTDKATIINNGTVYANLTVGSGDPTNYFAWYLNGVLQAAISGIGKMSHSTNQVGTWEVREVKTQADLANPSCYSNAKAFISEKQIFASIVTSPTNTPLCLGDQWTLSGKGGSNLTWSSGKGILTPTTGASTTYTATGLGMDIITLTGDVITGDLVVNGDFENLAQATTITSGLPYANDPTGSDGTYSVANNSLKNGTWANPDWNYNNTRPTVNGNPGNFMILNNPVSTSETMVWSQDVTVSSGNSYTFSFDLTSVSYIVSKDVEGYSGTPKAPYKDVILNAYINGVLVGTASTDFGANGGLDAVGKWLNFKFPWVANSNQAKLEIRQAPTSDPRGYDYALDNIAFGGLAQQSDEITIGPITDCSAIIATASACIDDSLSELTATMTGGLVFDRWEDASGNIVGTKNPLKVKTPVAATYTAVAYMVSGNVLDNGNFESGPTGFIYGDENGYFKHVTSMQNGGDNQFIVSNGSSNGTSAGNQYWSNLTPPVGGSRMLAIDSKGPVNSKVIGWTFTASAGDKLAFSGWVANQHSEFAKATPDPNSAVPAKIGIYINNTLIATGETGLNQNWVQMTANWLAPSSGTFTLEVRDLQGTGKNGTKEGGNDFVLDDFSLSPATGIIKKATTTTPVCDPCAIKASIKDKTYCGNSGYVSLTPHASELPGVVYSWYDKSTNPSTFLGTTTGGLKDTIDVSGVPEDASGNKTVYYTKTAKASGTVFKRSESCQPSFNTWIDQGNVTRFQNQFTSTKEIKLTELDISIQSDYENNTNIGVQNGTINFNIVGSKINNGALVPDLTNVIESFSKTFSRTRASASQPQKLDTTVTVSVNKNVPAGVFFIVVSSVTLSGPGKIYLGKGNCQQAVPVKDDLDGQTVSLTGYSEDQQNKTANPAFAFNIDFELPAATCPRTPVVLTEDCPCSQPKTVVVNKVFDNDTTLCAGSNLIITGEYTLDATKPVQKAHRYSWYKKVGTTITVITPPTLITTSPVTLTLNNVTVANEGTYFFKVEDGDGITSNKSCYIEDSLKLTVNVPNTPVTPTTNQTICSGTKPVAFVTPVAAGGVPGAGKYQWFVNGKKIAGSTGNGQNYTFASPADTIFKNTSTTNIVYTYIRRDSSGVCPAVNSNPVTITVQPQLIPGTISDNQTICKGAVPAPFTSTLATGGSGTYTYSWEQSANNIAFSPATGGTGASTSLFTPTAAVNAEVYYRRKVSSGTCPDQYSDTIKISLVPDMTAAVISSNQTICYNTTPADLAIGTAPTNGLKAGDNYTYSWESLADAAGSVWTATSITTPGYDFGTVLMTDTMKYRLVVTGSCGNTTSNEVTINVLPELQGGTIDGGGTVCSGEDPADITNLTSPTGANGSGDYTYNWQISINGGAFAAGIPGSSGYAVPPFPANTGTTAITYTVKRGVTSTYCPTPTAESNEVTYTVNPTVKPGSIKDDQTKCSGNAIDALVEDTAPTGGDGTNYTYQWQYSTTGTPGTFVNVPGVTGSSFTPDPQASTIYFARLDNSPGCQGVLTDPVKITILPGILAGSIGASDQDICSGSTPALISTVTPPSNVSAAAVSSWEYFNTTAGTWDIAPAQANPNDLTYQYPATLSAGTLLIRKAVYDPNGPALCNSAQTAPVTITIWDILKPGQIGANQTICEDGDPVAFTGTSATGGKDDKAYRYYWQYSTNGISWTTINNSDSPVYDPGALNVTTRYRRVVNDELGCGPVNSNEVIVTVNPNLTPYVKISDPLESCHGELVKFDLIDSTNLGLNPTYEWSVGGSVQGTNSPTFSTTSLADGEVVFLRVKSSEKCIKPGTDPAISNAVTVKILSNITPKIVLAAPDKICEGTSYTVIPETASGGGANPTYQWFKNGQPVGGGLSYAGVFDDGDQINVIMTSVLGCVEPGTNPATSNTITMQVLPIPQPNIAESDATFCSGEDTTYTAIVGAGTTLMWYKDGLPINITTPTLTVNQSGLYYLKEDNGVCPRFSDTVLVNVIPTPVANAGSDIYVLENTIVTLNGSGGDLYSWSPATGLSFTDIPNPTFTAKENTIYMLTVADATNTCSSTDEVQIFVERPVRIPNAFTPNKDGNNDTWEIENINGFPNVTFEVYNRWGTLVWKSTGNLKMWDGTNFRNGEVLPDGTYFYVIDLHSVIFSEPYSGYVQILK